MQTPLIGPPSEQWDPLPYNAFTRPAPRPRRDKVIELVIAASVVLIVIGGGAIANIALGKDWPRESFTWSSTVGPSFTPAVTTPPTPAAMTTPSPKPTPPVPAADLDKLLLSGNEVAAATDWATSFGTSSPGVLDGLNPSEEYGRCTLATLVVAQEAYRGSGYKRARSEHILGNQTDDAPVELNWAFSQGVAAFRSAADAAGTVEALQPLWESCNNAVVKGSGTGLIYKLGTVTIDDGVLFISASAASAYRGWVCSRAIGARNNIVIDIRACAWEATKADAQNAYDAIAAKVDAAT